MLDQQFTKLLIETIGFKPAVDPMLWFAQILVTASTTQV